MYELGGTRALITGASSGIGRALARAMAAEGARLAVLARRSDRLEALADELEREHGARPVVVQADLSVRGAAARAAREIGDVDVLVNNAGGAVGGSVWAVADRDEARADFEVDFWSPLALIGAFVPGMRERGHGVVVNVTSIRQVFSWPSFGHNSAAQAALAQVTETLRLEAGRFGIAVVEVIPGPVETAVQGPTRLIPGLVEAVQERLGVATPEEIAARIVDAIRTGEPRVFCPEETTREMYEHPVQARAQIAAHVERVYASVPADDSVDTLVVGADHPLILGAREQWEAEHPGR